MRLFEYIASPLQAFMCMAFHRNLKMIHVSGGEHLLTCMTCEKKKWQDIKNEFLTILYFNRSLLALPLMIPIMIVGSLHQLITGKQGSFEQPPEHRRRRFV